MSFEPEGINKLFHSDDGGSVEKTIDVQRQIFNDLFVQGKITEQEHDKLWVDSQEVVSLLRIAYRRIIRTTVEVTEMSEERKIMENGSFLEFIPEVFDKIQDRLAIDDERWGQEWLKRPIEESEDWENQDVRIFGRYDTYFEEARQSGDVMTEEHWLKVIGNAIIAIVRLNHPELFPDGQVHPDWVEDVEED